MSAISSESRPSVFPVTGVFQTPRKHRKCRKWVFASSGSSGMEETETPEVAEVVEAGRSRFACRIASFEANNRLISTVLRDATSRAVRSLDPMKCKRHKDFSMSNFTQNEVWYPFRSGARVLSEAACHRPNAEGCSHGR